MTDFSFEFNGVGYSFNGTDEEISQQKKALIDGWTMRDRMAFNKAFNKAKSESKEKSCQKLDLSNPVFKLGDKVIDLTGIKTTCEFSKFQGELVPALTSDEVDRFRIITKEFKETLEDNGFYQKKYERVLSPREQIAQAFISEHQCGCSDHFGGVLGYRRL